jgi:hypothetical protein
VPGTSPGKGLLQSKFAAKRSHELPFNFPRTALQGAERGDEEGNKGYTTGERPPSTLIAQPVT